MPFIEEEPVFPESSCGVGPAKTLTMEEQRIVGGTEAVKNSWPGIVSFLTYPAYMLYQPIKNHQMNVYFIYFNYLFLLIV